MAITDAWTAIATTQTDKDSPLNETLFNALRGNGYHNYDWIGKDYTPADNHNHDGTNSAFVGRGGLNLSSTENSSSSIGGTYFIVSQSYAFGAEYKHNQNSASYQPVGVVGPNAVGSSLDALSIYNAYKHVMFLDRDGAGTMYGRYYYIPASPPHAFIGSDDFGHFLFLHRKASDGAIISASCAPDPVWDGEWSPLPKGHPARVAARPHPFLSAVGSDEEIVLVDLRHLQGMDTYRPRATAHAALCERRQEFAALGIAESEIAQHEAASAAKMAEEAEEQDKAAADLDTLDGSMPRLIAQAPETRPTLKGVVDVRADYFAPTKAQLHAFWISRKRILRKQAGHVTKIEKIQAEAEARGSSLLQEINEGRVPDAIATKEIQKADRDKLPNVPAFRDRVRVLRA